MIVAGVKMKVECEHCGGTGVILGSKMVACPRCSGTGGREVVFTRVQFDKWLREEIE